MRLPWRRPAAPDPDAALIFLRPIYRDLADHFEHTGDVFLAEFCRAHLADPAIVTPVPLERERGSG